jgi:hypothetical protein
MTQHAIFDSVVTLAANAQGETLVDYVINIASFCAMQGQDGLEYLRIAEQALRSCSLRREANEVHQRYNAEIAMVRDD